MNEMRYRPLGRTGEEVSVLGLGGHHIGRQKEEQDSIRVIHTRHEQATAYMADGYARTTGKVGVCLVVPGPGLLNATAALSTAYACSAPVLCLSGQIQSDLIGVGRGMLHEIPFQQEMLKSVNPS